jgi:hypothetical protein
VTFAVSERWIIDVIAGHCDDGSKDSTGNEVCCVMPIIHRSTDSDQDGSSHGDKYEPAEGGMTSTGVEEVYFTREPN